MTVRRKHISWLVALFFGALVAIVFQQIHTSMAEQGIATGSPYDNAAEYPRIIAILIGLMVIIQTILTTFGSGKQNDASERVQVAELKRPAYLMLIFAVYLGLLGGLGYHLTTAPMIFAVMLLCGVRFSLIAISIALLISFSLAYAFEVYLKVVLPGGIFGLNIPW